VASGQSSRKTVTGPAPSCRLRLRNRRQCRRRPNRRASRRLLAQAEFAVGKFREAVAAIHAGLRLQPDWSTVRFQPLTLYGANVADYPEHLALLEETLTRHPDDPVLLFLYAYQLWFDGRQDEAVPLFRRALLLVANPSFIRRFLQDNLVV
jgi:cytochrome c-type biogenesis protein CcmH/NrfG